MVGLAHSFGLSLFQKKILVHVWMKILTLWSDTFTHNRQIHLPLLVAPSSLPPVFHSAHRNLTC